MREKVRHQTGIGERKGGGEEGGRNEGRREEKKEGGREIHKHRGG